MKRKPNAWPANGTMTKEVRRYRAAAKRADRTDQDFMGGFVQQAVTEALLVSQAVHEARIGNPSFSGSRVQCLKCGHVGVYVESPDQGDREDWLFKCPAPACGYATTMDGPVGMPARGGPISGWGGDDD